MLDCVPGSSEVRLKKNRSGGLCQRQSTVSPTPPFCLYAGCSFTLLSSCGYMSVKCTRWMHFNKPPHRHGAFQMRLVDIQYADEGS